MPNSDSQITVSLPSSLHTQVEQLVESKSHSFASEIRWAIYEWVNAGYPIEPAPQTEFSTVKVTFAIADYSLEQLRDIGKGQSSSIETLVGTAVNWWVANQSKCNSNKDSDTELGIRIDVSEYSPTDDVAEELRNLLSALNGLDISWGGNGLTITDWAHFARVSDPVEAL